jgi:hypothetical protein
MSEKRGSVGWIILKVKGKINLSNISEVLDYVQN